MLSAIIATHESERSLVPTLAALVPGVIAGLISEVIVADAGSTDATSEVADLAGCAFMTSTAPLGARLNEAAAGAVETVVSESKQETNAGEAQGKGNAAAETTQKTGEVKADGKKKTLGAEDL